MQPVRQFYHSVSLAIAKNSKVSSVTHVTFAFLGLSLLRLHLCLCLLPLWGVEVLGDPLELHGQLGHWHPDTRSSLSKTPDLSKAQFEKLRLPKAKMKNFAEDPRGFPLLKF